jgi:hypothetical protein
MKLNQILQNKQHPFNSVLLQPFLQIETINEMPVEMIVKFLGQDSNEFNFNFSKNKEEKKEGKKSKKENDDELGMQEENPVAQKKIITKQQKQKTKAKLLRISKNLTQNTTQ